MIFAPFQFCNRRLAMMKALWTSSFFYLVTVAAFFNGPWANAADAIRVGELAVASDAPYYIAIEKGFFAKRGLTVTLHQFANTGAAMAPLSTGQLDVATGAV